MIEPAGSIEGVRELLSKTKEQLGTWEAVGKKFGINKTTAWRIVNHNYEPKDNEIRSKLGLDEIVVVRQHRDKQGRFVKRSRKE